MLRLFLAISAQQMTRFGEPSEGRICYTEIDFYLNNIAGLRYAWESERQETIQRGEICAEDYREQQLQCWRREWC